MTRKQRRKLLKAIDIAETTVMLIFVIGIVGYIFIDAFNLIELIQIIMNK